MASAVVREPYRFTVEEYLTFERAAEARHEYRDGVIYAMAGESPAHGTICTNLVISLGSQVRGTPCRVFSKDTKVRCGPYRRYSTSGFYAYPDLLVVCGPGRYHDKVRDVLLNPTVIIEVLSPATSTFDLGEKRELYRRWLPTLTDYVVVAQEKPAIVHDQRAPTGEWTSDVLDGLDAVLHLPSIHCTVPLVEVYERLEFPV